MFPWAKLRHSAPGVLALTTALVLLASCNCGASTSTSNTSTTKAKATETPSKTAKYTTVDACKLASATDASTAAGANLTQLPTGAGASTASICIFGDQTGTSGQAGVLLLAEVYPDQSAANAIQTDQVATGLAAQFGVSGVTNAKVVNGIGDKAVEYQVTKASGGAEGIFVFRANVVMFLIVSPAVPPADATKASEFNTKVEALATIAVSNLDKLASS